MSKLQPSLLLSLQGAELLGSMKSALQTSYFCLKEITRQNWKEACIQAIKNWYILHRHKQTKKSFWLHQLNKR